MEEDNVPSGWDYGPGNQDDNMQSGWDYGPGAAFDTGNIQNYGFDPNSALNSDNNLFNNAPGDWELQSPIQMSPEEMGAAGQMPTSTNWNPNSGGIQQVLSDLFNNKKAMTGIGALFEGFQNMQKANAMQGLASKMQGAMDPFGKQRAGYQTQLAAAIQNPYSSPIVQAQVEQLQRAQAAKDAAAGRRSNSATSSPALLAAQAQIAQNYINSLMAPAGANINPSGLSSLLQTQQQGINSGINGFVSPLLSAAGYATGNNNTAQDIAAIKEKLGL